MSSISVRVDDEVLERIYLHIESFKDEGIITPNQVMRHLLGLPLAEYPKGGASRRPLTTNPAPHIAKAKKLMLKGFHELNKIVQ